MTSELDRSVEATAALYGIEAAWVDATGQRRTASTEVVVEALRRLGAPIEGEADVGDAAGHRRRAIWERACPPVRTARSGDAPSVPMRLPAERARGPLQWHLACECGGTRSGEARVEALGLAGGSSVDGRSFEIRRLELPADLPLGYHRLIVRHRADEFRLALIVAPGLVYRGGRLEGRWGIFHPLFGLRDERAAGVGDLRTLRNALEWTSARGGVVFGTTPLTAPFVEPPIDPSPYAPASRLFWDDRYVELEAAPGFAEARAAGALSSLGRLAAHRADELVPWDALTEARNEALSILADRFFARGGDRSAEFQRFLASRPDAGDFARFHAARAAWGADWRAWPEPAHSGRPEAGALDRRIVRRHLFGQWTAARQIAELSRAGPEGAELYLDVPLGSHPDGYDVWRYRDLFATGVATGAPPDDFLQAGQNWGLPPLHPERIRENGFGYVGAVLRQAMRPAGLVRIDHVMQLHRLFWIPQGAKAADGVYVRYPAEELAAVLALESHRAACEVVGEDLGTVPDAVRELMERRDIRRTAVLGFALDELTASGPFGVPAGAVATIESHDMVPLAGLRAGLDLEERARSDPDESGEHAAGFESRSATFERLDERFGVGDEEAGGCDPLLGPLLAGLGASPAGVVVVPLDDLFGVELPQNVPGTSGERPNWRRRLPAPLDAGLSDAAERALDRLRAARRRAGQGAPGVSRSRP